MPRVELAWVPPEEGGRKRPALPGYACTVSIEGRQWSVIWDGENLDTLVPTAPPIPDAFELYEGSRVVARGAL
jgi:hypothetical protein